MEEDPHSFSGCPRAAIGYTTGTGRATAGGDSSHFAHKRLSFWDALIIAAAAAGGAALLYSEDLQDGGKCWD
jgi:hypothetical protein